MREKREQKRKNIIEITVKNSTKLQIQESPITSMINAGFPGGSVGKESAYKCMRPRFSPYVGKISWRRKW